MSACRDNPNPPLNPWLPFPGARVTSVPRSQPSDAAPLPRHAAAAAVPRRARLTPRHGCRGVRGQELFLVLGLVRRGRLGGRAAPPGRRGAGRDGVHRRGGGGGPAGLEVGNTEAGVGRARG